MKVADLFRQLSYGELSNLSISGSGSGNINEEKRPQILQYINDGLVDLHTRFVLLEKTLLIEQVEHITRYVLSSKYAETKASSGSPAYIKDLQEAPFEDDLIKVLAVYHSNGTMFPLNDVGNPHSVFTPQPQVLQVMNPVQGQEMALVYQATPAKLDETAMCGDYIIDIPIFLENALRLYITHKVFNHMNGTENTVKSLEILKAYEAVCQNVVQSDLVNQSFHTSHSKLEQRGFA